VARDLTIVGTRIVVGVDDYQQAIAAIQVLGG
jgi:hypothetical protein